MKLVLASPADFRNFLLKDHYKANTRRWCQFYCFANASIHALLNRRLLFKLFITVWEMLFCFCCVATKDCLQTHYEKGCFFWTKSINHWFNAESLTYFGWMGLFARIVAAKNRVTLEPKTIVGKRIYQLYVSSIPQLSTTINFSCFLERDCNLDQKLSRHHQESNYWVTQRYRKA